MAGLVRHTFRLHETVSGRVWARLGGGIPPGMSIEIERRRASTVWVRLEGSLSDAAAVRFASKLRSAMARKKDRVVLDLGRVVGLECGTADRLAEGLRSYRNRIRVVLPRVGESAAMAAVFAHYR
jgi:anti-anti-sigma regulatory factor